MSGQWQVLTPCGYDDKEETADSIEVVEGCLIFSDDLGTVSAYSPGTWRMVVRKSDGRAVA